MLLRQSALLLEIDLDFLKQGFEPQFVGPRIVAGKEDRGLWENCLRILVAGIEAAFPKYRNHFIEFLVAIVQRLETATNDHLGEHLKRLRRRCRKHFECLARRVENQYMAGATIKDQGFDPLGKRAGRDRKRVVWGKRVSVRVDLGDRRY